MYVPHCETQQLCFVAVAVKFVLNLRQSLAMFKERTTNEWLATSKLKKETIK